VLSAERQKLQAEVEAADKHLRARQHQLSASGGSLTETVRQAEQALALLPEAEARLAKLQKDLAAGAFARDEQQKLERVEAEAAALGYEPTAHERARKEADALRPAERAQRDLDEAQRRLPEEQGRLETLAKDIHLEEQLAGQERETVERLQAEARALPQVLSAVQGLEREQKALADEVNALRSEQGEVRGQLNRLMEVEQALGLRRRERQEAATEQGLYEDLVRAFGRSGVQALIIETAIPQIQDEANDLLGRMTDNRMHVKLDTLGTRKTREGPVETLDIKVSDELGTRPYETFSGGEAFRVNIALRIALSQLLARRAGAPLPTLFIDEGFGTQDTAARDKVVEAITAIQDQFQRILVITHIDEMKEQFPVRIEVTKTPEGSTFVVV
jgi:exonuclease SbcC